MHVRALLRMLYVFSRALFSSVSLSLSLALPFIVDIFLPRSDFHFDFHRRWIKYAHRTRCERQKHSYKWAYCCVCVCVLVRRCSHSQFRFLINNICFKRFLFIYFLQHFFSAFGCDALPLSFDMACLYCIPMFSV